jgi:hypothetical protein
MWTVFKSFVTRKSRDRVGHLPLPLNPPCRKTNHSSKIRPRYVARCIAFSALLDCDDLQRCSLRTASRLPVLAPGTMLLGQTATLPVLQGRNQRKYGSPWFVSSLHMCYVLSSLLIIVLDSRLQRQSDIPRQHTALRSGSTLPLLPFSWQDTSAFRPFITQLNCSRSYIPPLASTLFLPSVMSRLHTHQRRPRAHQVTYTLATLLVTLLVIICVCPVAVGAQYNTQEYENAVDAYERNKQLYGNVIGIGSSIQ